MTADRNHPDYCGYCRSIWTRECPCNDASNLFCQGCGSNPADPCEGYPLYCTPVCEVQLYPEPK